MDTTFSSTALFPLVARENEFTLLERFLLQQNQQQLLLVGHSGTGRTSLVRNLAGSLANDWLVKWLDLNLLHAINNEQFLATLKSELTANFQEKTLIVIDELDSLHHLPLLLSNVVNCLKLAFYQFNLHLIIISDWRSYQKFFANDNFLMRKLQRLELNVPTPSQAFHMLLSQQDALEQLYQTRIDTNAMAFAIEIAKRHITDCYLPKSAFDIMHQATAATKQQHKEIVDKSAIVNIAQTYLSIDTEFIIRPFSEKLLQLVDNLNKTIVGQQESCELISQHLQSHFLNFGKFKIFTAILTGIAHMGKTTLAITLAKELFGSVIYFKKIDLANYQRESQISELIKQLAAFRVVSPCGVWFFDNMQSASLETIFALQQIIETGQLGNDAIHSVPLSNTIFLFNMQIPNEKWRDLYSQTASTLLTATSSPSSPKNELLQLVLTDFPLPALSTAQPTNDALITALHDYLANHFGQSFIAHTAIIPFHPLTVKHSKSLLEYQIKRLSEASSITITFDHELMNDLITQINGNDINGMQVSKIIYREIMPILNQFILQAKVINKDINRLFVSKNRQGVECQIVE